MLHAVVVFGFVRSSLRFHVPVKLKANWASTAFTQVPRFEVPSRYDTCKLLISGVVGTDPKEIYLKSGHYVVNFAVSIVLLSPLAHAVFTNNNIFRTTVSSGGSLQAHSPARAAKGCRNYVVVNGNVG